MKLADHVDLKDLEQKARNVAVDGDADWGCPDPSNLATDAEKAFIEAMSPAVALALIRRIRALEGAAHEVVDESSAASGSVHPRVRSSVANLRAILDKGAVLQ